jgi:hypothetical protein
LGAESCVIGTKDFLTKIERIGFHAYHAKARLPFIQVQTALVCDLEKGKTRDTHHNAHGPTVL